MKRTFGPFKLQEGAPKCDSVGAVSVILSNKASYGRGEKEKEDRPLDNREAVGADLW